MFFTHSLCIHLRYLRGGISLESLILHTLERRWKKRLSHREPNQENIPLTGRRAGENFSLRSCTETNVIFMPLGSFFIRNFVTRNRFVRTCCRWLISGTSLVAFTSFGFTAREIAWNLRCRTGTRITISIE